MERRRVREEPGWKTGLNVAAPQQQGAGSVETTERGTRRRRRRRRRRRSLDYADAVQLVAHHRQQPAQRERETAARKSEKQPLTAVRDKQPDTSRTPGDIYS